MSDPSGVRSTSGRRITVARSSVSEPVEEIIPVTMVAGQKDLFELLSPEMGYRLRGMAYVDQKLPDRVISETNQLLKLCPQDPFGYGLRGSAYVREGDRDAAIADLSEALKRDPKWGFIYLLRGAVYSEKGDHNHSVEDLIAARRLDPEDDQVREHSVRAYNLRGDAHWRSQVSSDSRRQT